MSTIEFISTITRQDDVTDLCDKSLLPCKKHGIPPTIYDVFTGERKNRFKGSIAECGNSECSTLQSFSLVLLSSDRFFNNCI